MTNKFNSGVYKITNTVNGHCYIGSSKDIYGRWKVHRSALERNKHHSPYLQRSYNKHGKSCFKFELMLCCDEKHLLFFEQRAIDILKPVYNILKKAGSTRGHKHTDATRAKMSASRTGKKYSPERLERNRLRLKNLPPHRVSEATKQKLREVNLGKKLSPETCAKMSVRCRGEGNPSAKITWDIVREMRRLHQQEGVSRNKLAKQFHLSTTNTGDILNNKIWREVEDVKS